LAELIAGAGFMLTQIRRLIFCKTVTTTYCRTCHAVFGKTISVMAGEAGAKDRWYGLAAITFIDWLLAEPNHCANQFIYYTRLNRR